MHRVNFFYVQCYTIVILMACYYSSMGKEIGPKRARYIIPFLRTGRSDSYYEENSDIYDDEALFSNFFKKYKYPLLDGLPLIIYPQNQMQSFEDGKNYVVRDDYIPRLGRKLEK